MSQKTNRETDLESTTAKHVAHRIERLREVLEKSTAKCRSSSRLSDIRQRYARLAKHDHRALSCLHEQYQEYLKTAMKDEIEMMFEEEPLDKLLCELDELIAESGTSSIEPAWRPSGSADIDVQPHLVVIWRQQRDRLQQQLNKLQRTNKRLQTAINSKHQKLQNTVRDVENSAESIVQVCREVPTEEVEQFKDVTT